MAEHYFIEPLESLIRRYGRVLFGLTAGLFVFVAGLIGYDLGKRSSTIDIPEETRWMGRVLWEQILFGLAILGYAYYHYRKTRAGRN